MKEEEEQQQQHDVHRYFCRISVRPICFFSDPGITETPLEPPPLTHIILLLPSNHDSLDGRVDFLFVMVFDAHAAQSHTIHLYGTVQYYSTVLVSSRTRMKIIIWNMQ